MPRLKVFATTSGIHDHVVAAPSRPAALKAWGAKTDLFSMGVARQVTDPKIVKQAMARPGEVLRLGRTGRVEDGAHSRKKAVAAQPASKPPSRARLAAAEEQLEELIRKQAKERAKLERELSVLSRQQEQLEKRHSGARLKAEQRIDDARDAYQSALDDWEG